MKAKEYADKYAIRMTDTASKIAAMTDILEELFNEGFAINSSRGGMSKTIDLPVLRELRMKAIAIAKHINKINPCANINEYWFDNVAKDHIERLKTYDKHTLAVSKARSDYGDASPQARDAMQQAAEALTDKTRQKHES